MKERKKERKKKKRERERIVSCRDDATSVSAVTVCVSTRMSERIANYPVSQL